MSAIYVTEKHASRRGPTIGREGKRTASRTFIVRMSSPHDDGIVARRAAGVPRIGQTYSVGEHADGGLRVSGIDPQQIAQLVWEVTVKYDSSSKSQEPTKNPLDRPPLRSYTSASMATYPWKDLNGKVFNNSAGQLLENSPPVMVPYGIITIQRNEAVVFHKILALYTESTNADMVFGVRPGYVLMKKISAAEQEENGVRFFRFTYELYLLVDGKNKDDWNAHVLDIGDWWNKWVGGEGGEKEYDEATGLMVPKMRHVFPPDDDGDKIIRQHHLDGKGGLLPEARVKKGDGVFLDFRTHEKMPFRALNLE